MNGNVSIDIVPIQQPQQIDISVNPVYAAGIINQNNFNKVIVYSKTGTSSVALSTAEVATLMNSVFPVSIGDKDVPFIAVNIIGTSPMVKHLYFFKGGKGLWGGPVGGGGTQVDKSHLSYLITQNVLAVDIEDGGNTSVIPLGVLPDGDYISAANAQSRNLTNPNLFYFLKFTTDGVDYLLRFIGTEYSMYGGSSTLQFNEDDFESIPVPEVPESTQNNIHKVIPYTSTGVGNTPLSTLAVANLVNGNFPVSILETTVPWIAVNIIGTSPMVKHLYLFTGGKGLWGGSVGSGGTQVDKSMFQFFLTQNAVPDDVQDGGNTSVIPLGTLSDGDYITAANAIERDLTNPDLFYFLKFTYDGTDYLLQFIGATYGLYGGAHVLQFVEADFEEMPVVVVPTPAVPTLKQITDGSGNGYTNHAIVVESVDGSGAEISRTVYSSQSISLSKDGITSVVESAPQTVDGITYTIPAKEADDTFAMLTDLLEKEDTITAGTTSQYWRGDKSWRNIATAAELANTNPINSDAVKTIADRTINYNKPKIARTGILTAGSIVTSSAITGTSYAYSNSVFKYFNGYPAQAGSTYPNYNFIRGFHVTGTAHQAGFSVEFYTNAPAFELYFYNNQLSSYRIIVDGVIAHTQTSFPASNSQSYQVFTFATTSTKRVVIEGGNNFWFGAIKVATGYTLTNYTALVSKPKAIILSDSFGEPAGNYRWDGWIYKFGELIGWDAWASGSGGTGYVNSGVAGRFKFADRLNADVIAYAPDVVIVAGGINDASYSISDFTTQVDAVFTSLQTNLPNAKVYIIGNWRPNQNDYTAWDEETSVLEGKSKAYGFTYIDVRNWFTGNGTVAAPNGSGNADYYIMADGTHPTQAGHAYLGARVAAFVQNDITGKKALYNANPGTVTAVFGANGVSISDPTSTPTVSLGNITPTSVVTPAVGTATLAPNGTATNLRFNNFAGTRIATLYDTGNLRIDGVNTDPGYKFYAGGDAYISGQLIIPTAPVVGNGAANKTYVDSYVIINTTTTALSSATLNSTYPNVKEGTRVICPYISTGPVIYTKAVESGTSDIWLTAAQTITA